MVDDSFSGTNVQTGVSEIKDATADTRASVSVAGGAGTNAIHVQGIAGGLAQSVSFSPSGNDTTERIALTAGGTPEQLTAHAALEVTVQALTGNTTYVYVGTTATPAADGVELVQGSSFTFSLTADTDEIWWVSATIADEVTITYRS